MGQNVSRGVSSVISVLLLVAVVVVVAATVAVFALDFGSDVEDTAPVVSQSSGELRSDVSGSNDQTVRLTHQAGDTFRVRNIHIVVDAQSACGKTGRLVNLPAPDGDLRPTEDYVRGDDIFDNSYNSVTGPIGEDDRVVDGKWSAGETATFRIASSACGLSTGSEITVRLVHTPTNAVMVKKRLTAT